ncbi:MAG: hypothetical protein RBR22_07545 [Desulfuromonas sp.]|nr:hypothetical protein [Desulfuromonas sp.]
MCQNSPISTEATLTLAQAAEQLGTTPMNILMHLKHKLLVGSEEDGEWSISAQSLCAFKAKNHGSDKTLCKKHSCSNSQCGTCS